MPTDLRKILELRVPIIARIGQTDMAIADVLALGPGSILELSRPADATQDLLVNNKPIGRGIAVKVGENFGIRVTEIGSPQERIEALAGD